MTTQHHNLDHQSNTNILVSKPSRPHLTLVQGGKEQLSNSELQKISDQREQAVAMALATLISSQVFEASQSSLRKYL